jgi:hypothetical protein
MGRGIHGMPYRIGDNAEHCPRHRALAVAVQRAAGRRSLCRALCLAGLCVVVSSRVGAADETAAGSIQFNRDVRPILADHCFRCHGPDSTTREAELRLDVEESLFAVRKTGPIVERGKPLTSSLYRRILSTDPDVKMPPPDSGKELTPVQIETLRRWIEQGAQWEGHWAFQPLVKTSPSRLPDEAQILNGIDRFVQAELAGRRQLSPTSEAAAETLVRRVTLDLTGLPPTTAEIDAYRNDPSADRYERFVDRLLASPRYGEHMAVAWLDAARYADTSGYQTDGTRFMWRWRDWLIGALNSGMPFDQMTVEMLAGDLLPDATLEQQIASGFNRNHRGNSEGGSIAEEFLVENVVDRVDTTATVWLGLTIGCARCHDHKYDPISQREYYQLFSYFYNVPESGRALKVGNSPPFIKAPTEEQQRQLHALDQRLGELKRQWESSTPARQAAMSQWEKAAASNEVALPSDWTVTLGQVAAFPLDRPLDGGLRAVSSSKASADTKPFIANAARGMQFDGLAFVDAGDVGNFGFLDSFTVSAWVRPDGDLIGGIVSRMSDDSDAPGWAIHLEQGKLQANFVKRWLDDALRVETVHPLNKGVWQHVLVTYDGSRVPDGVRIYVNGVQQPTVVRLDALNQEFASKEPLRIGATGTAKAFKGGVADVRLFGRVLESDEALVISAEGTVRDIASTPRDQRHDNQNAKLAAYFEAEVLDPSARDLYRSLKVAEGDRNRFFEAIPTSMVMKEMPAPRSARVLLRGSYEHPADEVASGTPKAIGGPAAVGTNRLALAKWLTDPANPLPARVTVNREWQRFFGVGIVKTTEDFGIQGDRPSHPRLLDWLAGELIDQGWDLKELHRLIVTSHTYRQSSDTTPQAIVLDPENRLLARGARFRMTAEMIRDQALAVSGLLSERVGGESVKSYQPDGLWSSIASDTKYELSRGSDVFRRSMYSFCKRTVGNPTLTLFDATTRETCLARRGRTNTPLQALALMNDVTYVEAARNLAQRVLSVQESSTSESLARLFQQATGRPSKPWEINLLESSLTRHEEHYRNNIADAQLLCRAGTSPLPIDVDLPRLAAYTAVASIVLNLDEFVTRE